MIQAIAHPTDFSAAGALAFDHALALALHHRARLDLLHVGGSAGEGDWGKFPRVRERLEAWGRIPPGTSAGDVAELTGVAVRKIELHEADPAEALGNYLADHLPNLIVMASHARSGLARLLAGSVSSSLLHQVQVPMLLLGPRASGFVDPAAGALALQRVLVPVDHEPDAAPAFEALAALVDGSGAQLDCLHVGKTAPALRDPAGQAITVRLQQGPPVETILAEAHGAQAIAMASEGRHGLGDALLGSTTERVLAGASVPVLALPVN
jgi:nucleotide-binding universal stress UspA family protein